MKAPPEMNQTPSGARRPAARLLTVDRTAKQPQLSSKSARRLIECGDLVAHRIGRRIRVAKDDLRTFPNSR